ncbi:MAG: YbhB/YbcL family Raf kinase inhibitor-like protein [Pseudomonadota bacterium]
MEVNIDGWADGEAIPSRFAFGKIPEEGRFELGGNMSPGISWSGAPEGTKSFAIVCHDPDVPSVADDVNQEGKTIPSNLPRVDFYHWILSNIPSEKSAIAEGQASNGVTPKGKPSGQKPYGIAGVNNYTDWFAGDADMGGVYADYDGPCPPWNDSIVHHYHFTVYALDVADLGLSGEFGGPQLLEAMDGHILASGSYVGTYSMNPDVTA